MKLRCLCVVVLTFSTLIALAQGEKRSNRYATQRAFEVAVADPFDRHKQSDWLASLPKDHEFFIVEGDLLMTTEEALAYLVARASSEVRVTSTELIVNRVAGEDDYYSGAASRLLTYFIETDGFTPAEVQIVVGALEAATADWQNACPECGISFVRATSPNNVNFKVRRWDVQGAYIAASFFPHNSDERRYLNIDPSFFTTSFDKAGVFRHELGHVLGYRHEHIRGVPGCFTEDNQWRPLTEYDPHSVMHYFCGGGGSMLLKLTSVDITGHKALYGKQPNSAAFTPPPPPKATAAAAEAFKRALASPNDPESFVAYRQTLPKVGEFYIVEGDLKMTDEELRAYVLNRAQAPSSALVRPELLLNLNANQPDFYSDPQQRRLTYWIDAASFDGDQARTVAKNFQAAADEWVRACPNCGISFSAVPQDKKPNFIIRKVDGHGAFVALAFFPHDDSSRRIVEVDPSYFSTSYNQVGVFRHEIGHILGYRHEQIRGIAGCAPECADPECKARNWIEITPYDARSVMHYLCGGGGSRDLALTKLDKEGHRATYRTGAPDLVHFSVWFRKGDIPGNVVAVLQALEQSKLLDFQTAFVETRNSQEDLILGPSQTRLDLDAKVAGKVLRAFNPNWDESSGALKLPRVDLRPSDNTVRFYPDDPKSNADLANFRISSADQSLGEIGSESGSQNVKVRMYQLDLMIPRADFDRALQSLPKFPAGDVILPTSYFAAEKFSTWITDENVSSRIFLAQFWDQCTRATDKRIALNIQGDVLSVLGVPLDDEIRGGLATCKHQNCPVLVLLDHVNIHEDFKDALMEGGHSELEKPLIEGDKQVVDIVQTDRLPSDDDHGSHLAGLIAAQDNGYGLIGVHPGAHLVALEWDPNTIYQEAEKLEGRDGEKIYVFASDWPWTKTGLDRLTENQAAAVISDIKPLWVVSAGENKSGGNGSNSVDSHYPFGPMSLGDLDNVVVVTGYEEDPRAGAFIPASANYGTAVTLAAPWGPFPSTISQGRYVRAAGTSQAAALVGALTSAMTSLYSGYYHKPHKIKEWLMLTARPSLPTQDFHKVASGLLDAGLALRDPRESVIRRIGQKKPSTIKGAIKWCSSTVELTDPSTGASSSFTTDHLRRLFHRSDGTWVGYAVDPKHTFQRYDPANLKDPNAPVFSIDGQTVRYNQIDDILFATDMPHEACR